MYLTCAFIPCLASHTFYYISLEIQAALYGVAKRCNSPEECGQFVWFEQQCWRYSRALISPVILQRVNSQCTSYLCAFIAKVWAAHEMDGPLTCSDKQPGSINIPLSLALFFSGSKGISRLQDCMQCLTGNHADPHVGPPVAPLTAFHISIFRRAPREKSLRKHCLITGTFSCWIILCNPQRVIKQEEGGELGKAVWLAFKEPQLYFINP